MKRLLVVSLIVFIFSVLSGYFIGSYIKRKKDNNFEKVSKIKNENLVETSSVDEKLSYNANFYMKKCYLDCGHFKYIECELPLELVNLSKDEIGEKYKKWNIEDFSRNKIVLSENINDICDEHYRLGLKDGYVVVYKMINKSGDESVFIKTNIPVEYLANQDIEKLEEGMEIVGLKNVNLALEDFE